MRKGRTCEERRARLYRLRVHTTSVVVDFASFSESNCLEDRVLRSFRHLLVKEIGFAASVVEILVRLPFL